MTLSPKHWRGGETARPSAGRGCRTEKNASCTAGNGCRIGKNTPCTAGNGCCTCRNGCCTGYSSLLYRYSAHFCRYSTHFCRYSPHFHRMSAHFDRMDTPFDRMSAHFRQINRLPAGTGALEERNSGLHGSPGGYLRSTAPPPCESPAKLPGRAEVRCMLPECAACYSALHVTGVSLHVTWGGIAACNLGTRAEDTGLVRRRTCRGRGQRFVDGAQKPATVAVLPGYG